MDIGVVLQCTPPAARVIDLAKRAETYGFSYVWTFDSHILWEEPYVIYSQILNETRNVIVGPMVTNPATRDWTVTASTYATLNEMFGNRTVCGIGRGDSAVRVTNGAPTTLATLRDQPTHLVQVLGMNEQIGKNGMCNVRRKWRGRYKLLWSWFYFSLGYMIFVVQDIILHYTFADISKTSVISFKTRSRSFLSLP